MKQITLDDFLYTHKEFTYKSIAVALSDLPHEERLRLVGGFGDQRSDLHSLTVSLLILLHTDPQWWSWKEASLGPLVRALIQTEYRKELRAVIQQVDNLQRLVGNPSITDSWRELGWVGRSGDRSSH